MILQSEAPECGIACVAMVASFHGFRTDLSAMRLRLAPSMKGVTLKHISAIADTMSSRRAGSRCRSRALAQLKLPAILHWDMNHFVVLTRVAGNAITVNDPARGRRVLRLAEVSDHYTGVAMEMTPATGFAERDEREKISAWQLVKTATGLRSAIVQVLLLSLVLEVLAIAIAVFPAARRRPRASSAATAICWPCSASASALLAVIDRRDHGAALLARRLHQHAAQPAAARHAVCAAAAAAAGVVREAAYRRHRVALPLGRCDPAHAFD